MRISDIKAALEAERDHCKTGIAFRVSAIRREGATVVVAVDTIKGRRSTAIDETLEGSRVVWGDNFEGHGKVFVVSPDTGELISITRMAHCPASTKLSACSHVIS